MIFLRGNAFDDIARRGGVDASLRRGSRAWMREPGSRDGFTPTPRQRSVNASERRRVSRRDSTLSASHNETLI